MRDAKSEGVHFVTFVTQLELLTSWTSVLLEKLKVTDLKVKVKVKLSLCLTKHHAMKTYWRMEV
jgi:uncharacterized protein (DUF362 family)